MKSLTTKTYTTLLLALLAALWSTNVWALTINVNASQEPYVYAWYGNTEFLGSFPGTKLTSQKTYGGETWYYIDVNASEVNIILSFGSGDSQTATINLNKNKYYRFTSNTANDVTDFVDYPNGVNDENGNYTYLVNVNGWSKVYAYIYDETGIKNAEWPGEEMTKVGKNNNGFDVYKWTGTNPSTPQTIIFNNNAGNQSGNLTWENGAIWSNFDFNHGVITGVVLDSEHFPDENFRTALSSITNVEENNILPTRNITVLDVSNKGISDLTGIANFTNLEELYAQDNSLSSNSSNGATTCLDISSNTKLRILDVSNNSNNGTGKLVQVPGIAYCTQLEEYYFNDNDFWGSRQISGTNSVAANRISAENHTKLKRLELRNSGIVTSFTLPSFPSLEYFDMSDNSSFNGFSAAFNIPSLKTFKMSNSNLKSTTATISSIKNSTGLEYLDISENTLDSINLFKNTALAYLDLSNNNLYYLNLANQKELISLNISYNAKLYCTVNNNSSVNFPSNVTNNGYIYMKNLPKLEEVDMSHCGIYRAGAGTQFEGLTSLKKLNLSYNHATHNGSYLASITTSNTNSSMQSLTALEELDLTGCSQLHMVQIDGLPLRVIKLEGTGLNTELVLTNNQLTNLNFPNETSLSTLTSLPSINVSGNPFTVLTIPATPNSLLTVTANDCSSMTRILAEHNGTKLQYVTAHNCPALTDMTINGIDMFFNNQVNAFDATNKRTITTLDFSNNAMLTNYALDGFSALTTIDFSNHYMTGNENNISSFTATNCPALTSVNLDGNANMETITLKSNGFDNSRYPVVTVDAEASNVTLDFSDNNFTAVPNIQASQINVLKLNDNNLTNINIPDGCNIHYLYAQRNNFGSGEYEMPETSLVGLDLGNNGFTKFKMTGNTTLKSLALSGNDALTEIELHGNTQLTQTSPDGVIESDNGLYINNLANLEVLNIENSNFNKLGQGDALIGLPKLKKLQARKNKFTTFTNGVYELHTSTTNSVNYRKPDPTQSSLERLEALEYLDLAYNNLQDSVHLYRNTALKHLDVSYNRSIDGQPKPAAEPLQKTAAQKAAILEQKGRRWLKYGKVKFNGQEKVYGEKVTPEQWTAHYTNLQAHRMRPFDLRDCDLNDTTGLYHLDLHNNVNLEYINFSYTNIHNTAAGPTFMCPGWMDEDWVTDDDFSATNADGKKTDGRWYSSWHTFVYFIPCSKLKVIHADHNNLSGFGVRYFPELDTLTCSYMYGESALMRDFPTGSINATSYEDLCYWKGNTGLQTSIKKFDHIDWDNVENPQKSYGVVLTGPDDNPTGNFPNKVRYYDNSYSSFNEIRFYPGTADNGSLPFLEYVNVSGNPLKCQSHPNSSVSNYNSLDLTYCPNIKTVLANNCDSLPTVRAYNRDALTTLNLTNDPLLKTVYAQDNAVLPSITGLSTLTGLETLFAYNNPQFGGIDVQANTALKNLWVSNIGASSLDVSHNTGLLKLRAYDNSLTTLIVSTNTTLTWLDVARNQIPRLDLSTNAALQYFNCSNSVETLDDQSLAANNHNGGEADEVKPVTDNHSADDSGNSLSDLVFNTEAPIADVRANSNDLHKITGSFGNLTHIEFAHNHINGIDLSAATGLTPADVIDEDNGRAITAECSKFYKNGDMNNAYTIYYFQLDPNAPAQHGGELLTNKTSIDSKKTLRVVGNDGLVIDNIDTWGGSNGNSGKLTMDVTVTPGNMGDYLSADDVIGTIVVLDPEKVTTAGAEGHATYTYKNGVSDSSTEDTSEFYLDWSSDGTVTGIDGVKVVDGVSVAGSYGQLTVTGADGTAIGVYDMNGRQVSNATITGGHATVTGLAPGIYLVNGQRVLVR